ncbi:hypothetical protein B0H10DRAFT_2032323, partial [Mycena sp. CBHHK59/15]
MPDSTMSSHLIIHGHPPPRIAAPFTARDPSPVRPPSPTDASRSPMTPPHPRGGRPKSVVCQLGHPPTRCSRSHPHRSHPRGAAVHEAGARLDAPAHARWRRVRRLHTLSYA